MRERPYVASLPSPSPPLGEVGGEAMSRTDPMTRTPPTIPELGGHAVMGELVGLCPHRPGHRPAEQLVGTSRA